MSRRQDAFVILVIFGVGLPGCGRGVPAPTATQPGARRTPANLHDHLEWDRLTHHQKEERQARAVLTGLGGTFRVRTNGVDLTPVPSLMFDGRTRLTDEQLARVTQLAEFDRFDPSFTRRPPGGGSTRRVKHLDCSPEPGGFRAFRPQRVWGYAWLRARSGIYREWE